MKTNKCYKITTLVLIMGLLAGCSAKIKSVKSPEFNQKPTRLLFTLENKSTDEGPGSFFDAFSEAFIAALKKRNIESMLGNESKLAETIEKYNPDVVMPVVQVKAKTSYTPDGFPYTGGATFEIKMYTPASPDRQLWTAEVKVKGNLTSGAKSVARKTVGNLIEKMEADGIIDVIQSK